MAKGDSGQKGYDFEELLRAYFLRAGFFVVRGVPIQFEGEDATDADLWLYERPTGTARRRQIADAKFKQKPKAAERMFWTSGLAKLLGVDGAYVATTKKSENLKPISKKLGLSLIDGSDLEKMKANQEKILYQDRITEEELEEIIKSVDESRKNKEFRNNYLSLKSAVGSHFGPNLINIALENFLYFAKNCITSHQNSKTAIAAGRMTLYSASIAAVALDHLSIEEPFRSLEERKKIFANAIRFGATNKEAGTEKLRLAIALIRQYANNGQAIARNIESAATAEFAQIPAEIIAEQAAKMSPNGQLFQCARALEHLSFSRSLPSFDDLNNLEKGFLAALLDFSDVDRVAFANSWKSEAKPHAKEHSTYEDSHGAGNEKLGPLFDQK